MNKLYQLSNLFFKFSQEIQNISSATLIKNITNELEKLKNECKKPAEWLISPQDDNDKIKNKVNFAFNLVNAIIFYINVNTKRYATESRHQQKFLNFNVSYEGADNNDNDLNLLIKNFIDFITNKKKSFDFNKNIKLLSKQEQEYIISNVYDHILNIFEKYNTQQYAKQTRILERLDRDV